MDAVTSQKYNVGETPRIMKFSMLPIFWEACVRPMKFLPFIIQNDFEFNQKHKPIVKMLL